MAKADLRAVSLEPFELALPNTSCQWLSDAVLIGASPTTATAESGIFDPPPPPTSRTTATAIAATASAPPSAATRRWWRPHESARSKVSRIVPIAATMAQRDKNGRRRVPKRALRNGVDPGAVTPGCPLPPLGQPRRERVDGGQHQLQRHRQHAQHDGVHRASQPRERGAGGRRERPDVDQRTDEDADLTDLAVGVVRQEVGAPDRAPAAVGAPVVDVTLAVVQLVREAHLAEDVEQHAVDLGRLLAPAERPT